MCNIPVSIDGGETIVRAVFSNHMDSKTRLRWTFFNERNDQASAMRHSYLGSDECKQIALHRITPGDPNIKYKGFAVIHAQEIRDTGAEVYDSREVYCGHAHVSTNIAVPPVDDPLHSATKLAREDRLRALRDSARFISDPVPMAETWTGGVM